MTPNEVRQWVDEAQAGECRTYFTGSSLMYAPRSIREGARTLLDLATMEPPLVHLTQRRTASGFNFIATRAR
ncbi:hypothetical protein [Maricaulis sp.]|uniref:hypothetical protein n=1 Tax=Maricaulis sp. TaxID=1486257 RepID=UPI0026058A99|nr:hypothetical protein [Maricaulis sp.]MDF1769859.1 hypothetical protein [Maricaulis sp.]